jgi:hypothetical protein
MFTFDSLVWVLVYYAHCKYGRIQGNNIVPGRDDHAVEDLHHLQDTR